MRQVSLEKARALAAEGRTSEAAAGLRKALEGEAGGLEPARYWTWLRFRDGWDSEILHLYERHRKSWERDPYLRLHYGLSLARLDRLAEARREVLAVAREGGPLRDRALAELARLESERDLLRRTRSAYRRAAGLALGGFLLLALCGGLCWVLRRRSGSSG